MPPLRSSSKASTPVAAIAPTGGPGDTANPKHGFPLIVRAKFEFVDTTVCATSPGAGLINKINNVKQYPNSRTLNRQEVEVSLLKGHLGQLIPT